jgi:hypothetical protein
VIDEKEQAAQAAEQAAILLQLTEDICDRTEPLNERLVQTVKLARRSGVTWSEIGQALHVSPTTTTP